jgi:ATP-binding cassette, subfamily B, bacterial MsbA
MKKAFTYYWPYIKTYKIQFFIILIGIVMTVSATGATAYIMQPMIDKMFIKRESSMLVYIPLGLVAIYMVKGVGRYLQAVFTDYIGLHTITKLRTRMLAKILTLDMGYLYANRSGEMISRITNDINRVQYFVASMLPEFIRELVTVVALIGYVIYLNAQLAFFALVALPVVILPLTLIAKRLKRLSHRSQEKNADIVTRLSEMFNNAEMLKLNATEPYEIERFDKENWYFFKINMKSTYTAQLSSPILEIVGAVGLAMVIYMGAKQVYASYMTVGEFTSFLTAVGLVFQPARGLGIIYAKMQDAIAASERIFHILEIENSIKDGTQVLEGEVQSIEFENVDLHYGSLQALNDIDFKVQKPAQIALVGDSGGGKSSIINALVRFYDPSSGEIRINDRALQEYKLSSLRDKIAVVSQRVYIFQDTLAQNVAYGHAMDETRVIEALQKADALDFAMQLSDGIHTQMDEFGANLSGGQRQRIAIARAIYKDASVLILDEASSALDNESEQRIIKTFKEYAKDKITITIAHRLSTIEHADRIFVMKQGSIIASGTHEELIENSAEYRRLYKSGEES